MRRRDHRELLLALGGVGGAPIGLPLFLRALLSKQVGEDRDNVAKDRPALRVERAALEREVEEVGHDVRLAELREGHVVEAEVVGARQLVRVGLDARDQLAQHDAVAEDVAALVVVVALQALRRHPVRGAHRREFRAGFRVRDAGRQAEVADDGLKLVVRELLHQHVLQEVRTN